MSSQRSYHSANAPKQQEYQAGSYYDSNQQYQSSVPQNTYSQYYASHSQNAAAGHPIYAPAPVTYAAVPTTYATFPSSYAPVSSTYTPTHGSTYAPPPQTTQYENVDRVPQDPYPAQPSNTTGTNNGQPPVDTRSPMERWRDESFYQGAWNNVGSYATNSGGAHAQNQQQQGQARPEDDWSVCGNQSTVNGGRGGR